MYWRQTDIKCIGDRHKINIKCIGDRQTDKAHAVVRLNGRGCESCRGPCDNESFIHYGRTGTVF